MEKEITLKVGILNAPTIDFVLETEYLFDGNYISGPQKVHFFDDKIVWNGKSYDEIFFKSSSSSDSFLLKDVVIGIKFHWERKEDQRFNGSLRLIVENKSLTAVNEIPSESYLLSVISSEMSATASKEFLKAHAVISRSWVLAQIENKEPKETDDPMVINDKEIIKWYDHEDHHLYDVCADDHCQRYQGITRASKSYNTVKQAIIETRGEVLMHDKKLCDARFSKSCGGMMEIFSSCWGNKDYPYLQGKRDAEDQSFIDLSVEENAKEWILNAPDAFCNTHDKEILSQVLNDYDLETSDFYRWKVSYSVEELSKLILNRSGIDFGTIQELNPIKRGTSGRIYQLEIVGSKKRMIIGKELEIRKYLSPSHLYSSAFVVEKTEGTFTLYGAGWGHGVGFCQIGAAVMAANGYNYKEILAHYYPKSEIIKYYE